MKSSSARGVTLFEISLVVLIAGLLIAAVVGGRAVANMARKNAVPKQVNGVVAAFQAFVEDRGRLPGDGNNSGSITLAAPVEDAPLDMIQEGFLDGASAEMRTAAPLVNEISLPLGLRGVITTSSNAMWGGSSIHVLRISSSDQGLIDDVEEVLDDGAYDGTTPAADTDDTTGMVRVDDAIAPAAVTMEIALDQP